ncbi:hypothetical protein M1D88_05375 [Arthrobacter sp. R1-13]
MGPAPGTTREQYDGDCPFAGRSPSSYVQLLTSAFRAVLILGLIMGGAVRRVGYLKGPPCRLGLRHPFGSPVLKDLLRRLLYLMGSDLGMA